MNQPQRKQIDFHGLAEQLLSDALSLLKEWLPAGKLKGREYTCGNVRGDIGDSLNINIDSGLWIDRATGQSGKDLIALYAAIHGIKNGEAAKQLGGNVTIDDVLVTGIECHPVPKHKHGKPSGVWEYRKENGELYGYVCRFDPLNEKKEFAPLTCWQTEIGELKWKWKKWPITSLPYRIEKLLPDCKVLICEGEKAAEAAQLLLPPDWVAIGWCGGTEAVKRTDWKALLTRYCWIWPDFDAPGAKAAKTLKGILPDLHIVTLPEGSPEGFDLADAPADFSVMDYLKTPTKQLTMQQAEVATETKQQRAMLEFTHHTDGNKLLATLQNMRDLLLHYGIIVRYNVISKRIYFSIPGESFSVENGEDAAFACIYSFMKEWQLPVDGYQPYLMRIADENQYNPVLDWITSKLWDGRSRLHDLYDTIQSPETEAKELLIRRWLITAVCMAKGEGVDSAGCLVLQGAQDLGKTWWVKKLVPDEIRNDLIRVGANVNPSDKDSVSQVISYWIVELGEIGATFRKADIDALKTFITNDHDTMRRPYGIGDKRYPRRTALVASVDQTIYLHDTAGNRRFWTIPCTAIDSYHDIDMQQLWAEVYALTLKGETWRLEGDEKAHIARINEQHMQIEPIIEQIRSKYDLNPGYGEWKTASSIGAEIGLKTITKAETRIINSFLQKAGMPQRISNGNKQFRV